MKTFLSSFILVLFLFMAHVSWSQSITTLFNENNGGSQGGAVYFDLTVGSNPISITRLDINTPSVNGNPIIISFYTLVGTSVGNQNNFGAWTLAGTATGNMENGNNNPSPVVFASPVLLQANTSYGIALVLDANHEHNYTNGTGFNQNYSNADLSLSFGTATNGPFTGGINNPRVWNGTIYYSAQSPIPTLGQWGLILLSLLLLTGSVVVLRNRQAVLEGNAAMAYPTNIHDLPMDWVQFSKILVAVMIGLAGIFSIAIAFFGYQLTSADIPGSLISGPVLAYLLFLLSLDQK